MRLAALLATTAAASAAAAAVGDQQDPDARVDALLAAMTPEEKFAFTNGVGWDWWTQLDGFYIGNIPANDRLAIPSLNMQDAGQGFRTSDGRMVGQVTSWSCALGLASTWDADLVLEWAQAAAAEHKAKGANVILGPGLNVHRVARGGRNAEYMSGEDPFLGAALAKNYVTGFQENGVLTVMKHFGLNQQETNRNSYNAIINEQRHLYELYYPPYEACAEADVAATMCSYNIVNGTHACGNSVLLTDDLKGNLGFNGWVMSDWAATHGMYASEGLDQDMPGSNVDDGWTDYFNADNMAAFYEEDPDRVDDMVRRVLTPMAKYGLLDNMVCSAGVNCTDFMYSVNATTDEHAALARTIAADSAVLLKNEDSVLPLAAATAPTVAIVGSACDAPNDLDFLIPNWATGNYYVVGGSGRVLSPDPVSVLEGLQARVAEEAGMTLLTAISDDVDEAKAVMAQADVVVMCGGANTTESQDRATLSLFEENYIVELTEAARSMDVRTVVVALSPGVVLMPFADAADAVVNLFLAGTATGAAVADVLFGDVNPGAKMPVTIPEDESETVMPCTDTDCPYNEGLFVGYRHMDANGINVTFPFGHGLSYTSFEYAGLVVDTADDVTTVTFDLTNMGTVAGSEVAQLYLGFPESAGMPPKVLKGFVKQALEAGETATVVMQLDARALSTWDAGAQSWTVVNGEFQVMVGSSSRDIRATSAFTSASVATA